MKEWTLEEIENRLQAKETMIIYFYTPLCGTCAVASRMMAVVKELLPTMSIGMSNMNYVVSLAHNFEMESVPCLLIFHEGKLRKKIYAFHSVEYVYNECRKYA